MAILKFRVYYEEDDTIYRDIVIKHKQTFKDLHQAILTAYEFDNKHQATFFRSNDAWEHGREISLDVYDRKYVVAPLMMHETTIGSEIKDTNQKFVYIYDFNKNWNFLVALINVSKEENIRTTYPSVSRKEGIGPPQYGTKSLLGEKFAEIEEKYDLKEVSEGFGEDGEEGASESSEEGGHEEETQEEEF
ncbi:IS1096 element passenger TnpR family protein [Parasediminibacterium sp. JCM 36343]|uniref:IS1096 element passenger TnpR family protein n=1 Tax=Parasediminibacterium sp. JCM 36343 TaxID=3374279 RepID=UPI00397A264B